MSTEITTESLSERRGSLGLKTSMSKGKLLIMGDCGGETGTEEAVLCTRRGVKRVGERMRGDLLGFPEKIRNIQTSVQLSELPIGLDANFPFQLLVLDMSYGDNWVDR